MPNVLANGVVGDFFAIDEGIAHITPPAAHTASTPKPAQPSGIHTRGVSTPLPLLANPNRPRREREIRSCWTADEVWAICPTYLGLSPEASDVNVRLAVPGERLVDTPRHTKSRRVI